MVAAYSRLPKPFLLRDAGIDSMSLELEALSFRVMVESDLNVEGMLIEPAEKGKKGGKNNTDKLH